MATTQDTVNRKFLNVRVETHKELVVEEIEGPSFEEAMVAYGLSTRSPKNAKVPIEVERILTPVRSTACSESFYKESYTKENRLRMLRKYGF